MSRQCVHGVFEVGIGHNPCVRCAADRYPETAEQMATYLAERGETEERHEHLWIEWDAWKDWGWNPHSRRSRLFVCDVPDCLAVRTEPE